MPNAENLKGHSFRDDPERINRKGRPRKLPELEELIVELLGEKGSESQMREILKTLIELAVGGNLRAAEIILNRAYGRVREHIEITSNDGDKERPRTTIVFSDGTIRDARGNVLASPGDPNYYELKLKQAQEKLGLE